MKPSAAVKKSKSASAQRKAAKRSDSAATPSWYFSHWVIAAATLALACLAYGAVMRGPYLFDDLTLPISSPFFRGEPFSKWIMGVRPVLMLSYWMSSQASPSSTLGYHLTNVLLHALNAWLVFGICRALFRAKVEDSRRVFVASAFACSLFLLHPLQTQSVAYIAGRSEVLSATFVLLAWLIYARRIGSPVTWLQSIAMLVLFGLAAVTKEQAVATIPAIVLLTDWTFRSGSLWSEIRANRRLYIPLGLAATLGTVGVGYLILTSRSAGAKAGITPIEYFLTECRALLAYVRLFLVPVGQNADPAFRVSRGFDDIGALLALGVILAGVWLLLRQSPLVRYGGLLFLAFLAPTSSIIPLADPFVEHRMYLPIFGLAIAASALLVQTQLTTQRLATVCAVVAVIAFFATQQRTQVWTNAILFWQDVVEKSPGKARGYQHLTHSYVAAGRCQEAINQLERAKPVLPRDYFTFVNWAQAHTCVNQPAGALEKLREAEKLIPTADVFGMMGDTLTQLGRTDEARQAYRRAILKEPPNSELAHVYIANLATLANNRARAEEHYLKALEINPYSPEAATGLRRLYGQGSPEQRSRSQAAPGR